MDSQYRQSFKNQLPYALFQEELSDLENMKDMIQTQNFDIQSIDRLNIQMSQLANTYRNEETLPYQSLTIPDIYSHIDLTQESWCFENQDSILSHPFELDQNQNFENYIDTLACYPILEIKLKHECDLDPQIGNSDSLFD